MVALLLTVSGTVKAELRLGSGGMTHCWPGRRLAMGVVGHDVVMRDVT